MGPGIAVDKQGEAYVTGQTSSPDFPVTTLSPVGATNPGTLVHGGCNPVTGLLAQPVTQTVGAVGSTTGGLCYDAFVTRLSADGQALLYSTYLGGGRDDMGYGIAADGKGDAYVTGRTESPDFPVSGTVGGSLDNASGSVLTGASYPACHETTCADAFAVKLDTTSGGLVPLGLPSAQAPALWTPQTLQQNAVTGTVGAVTGTLTGVLGVPAIGQTLGLTASSIVNSPSELWGRYLGGGNADEGRGIGLDPRAGASLAGGGVYLAGQTQSTDYPISTGAYSATLGGGTDAFVTRLLGATGAISYSTLLGGAGDDSADAVAVDTSGHAYVTGRTSSGDYPTIGTLEGFLGASGPVTTSMAYVTKLNKQGTALWYSTYLGGSGGDAGAGIGVDAIGDVWAAGATGSADFLTLRPKQPTLNNTTAGASQSGSQDAFVSFIDNTTRHFSYAYDGLQRLTNVTETLGNAYTYGYDLAGNRTVQWVNGAQTQQDGYDAADELVTATTPGGTTYDSYDAAGNLTGDATNSYSYDALDRLTALTNTLQQQAATYGYNGDGALVAQTAANGTTMRYTQDVAANPDPGQPQDPQTLGGLTPAVGSTPDQSGAGNQTDTSGATTQATPGGNGTSALVAPTGGFAPSGALPVRPLLAAQPATLGPVPATGGGPTGLSQVLQTTQQTTQGTSAPVDYLYGVGRLAATGAANPQAHQWYVADLQGSVRYTQDDTGSSAQSLTYDPVPPRYDPYGALDRGADGDGVVAQPFAYRGELQDAATGLIDLRARMYNPTSGQFLQRDPLEQRTGQAYAYAGANPIDHSDPSGQAYVTVGRESELGSQDDHDIRNVVLDEYIRNDSTHNSTKNVDGVYFPPNSETGFKAHADLLSVSGVLVHDPRVGAFTQGEEYDLIYNTTGGGFDPSNDTGVKSVSLGYLSALASPYAQGLSKNQLQGVKCAFAVKDRLKVALVLGFTYPQSFGDFVRAGGDLQGANNKDVISTGYQAPLTVVSRTPQHTQYRVYARLISNGFIGYVACRYDPNARSDTCTAPREHIATDPVATLVPPPTSNVPYKYGAPIDYSDYNYTVRFIANAMVTNAHSDAALKIKVELAAFGDLPCIDTFTPSCAPVTAAKLGLLIGALNDFKKL